MFIQVCLAVIALMLISLVALLIKIAFQTQRSVALLRDDLHLLSVETIRLLTHLNEFVRTDLHGISHESMELINKLTDLTSDINNKSRSLNFLFKPLGFLNLKLNSGSSSDGSNSKITTIPQVIKWLVSSVVLVKTTREFIKNYEKRNE